MANLDWDNYIRGAINAETLERCKRLEGPTMADQRELMSQVFQHHKPRRIACLGAGSLNDIPIGEFLMGGSEVFLVDWIPEISLEGFRGGLIEREEGNIKCMICDERCDPRKYCAGYREPVRVAGTVCAAFELSKEHYPRCAAYAPGEEPRFLTSDITLGRASSFARRAMKFIPSSRTMEQCFRKGMNEVRKCDDIEEEIAIPGDTVDLVTSSMVVSQFDHEPYDFFSKLIMERFGLQQVVDREERVMHMIERLRGELFQTLVEGHVQEMYRILNKQHGKVYLSVELFRSLPQQEDSYFLVHGIAQALDVLNRYFHFEFSPIPPEQSLRKRAARTGYSIIQCLVMSPIAA